MKYPSYQNFGMAKVVVGSNPPLGKEFFKNFKNWVKIVKIVFYDFISTNGIKQGWKVTEIVIKNKEI